MRRQLVYNELVGDIALRVFLFLIYLTGSLLPPFVRLIHKEELWLYKNPVTDSYCPMSVLWIIAFVLPLMAIFINKMRTNDTTETEQAILCFTLLMSLNGAITDTLKVIVGRPRPDFFYRCFPDGQANEHMICTGNAALVNDGRKSFPSGHSSVAFASFGFLSFYLAAKLKVFTLEGKGSSWKLLFVMCPLFFATCVAVSRTCDYHHHWQDVTVGSLIGILLCITCYFHFYPSLTSENCHLSWKQLKEKMPNTLDIKHV